MSACILAYHLVDRRFDFGIAWVTPAQFERQMLWLAEHGYRTRSLSTRLQAEGGESRREVTITFDDGYRALRQQVLPVLQRCQFTATVFPVVGYVGAENRWDYNLFGRRHQHLHWEELRELQAAGWEVGSHSWRHAYLPGLRPAELFRDLRDSRERLEQHLQTPIVHLSLPFGRGNPRVLQAAHSAGYRSVAMLGGEVNSAAAFPEGEMGLRIFPRRGVYLHDTLRSFRRRVESPENSRCERLRQRAISFFALGTIAIKTLGQASHAANASDTQPG